jgi:signal transduction histidine kinase
VNAPRWWRAGVNAAVVLLVFAVASGTVGLAVTRSPSTGTRIGAVLELVGLAALAFRRRSPAALLAFEVAIAVTCNLLADNSLRNATVVAVVIALYGFAITNRAAHSVAAATATGLAVGLSDLFRTGNDGAIGSHLVLVTAVTAVGFYVRSHRALLESYRERAEQAEREQQWQTSRAVAAERVRIARELHDVIAHHVSLLVVQAGAVRETLPVDHLTRPVLDSMIDGGRHAMTELRDMLDALRLDEGAASAAPPASAPAVAGGLEATAASLGVTVGDLGGTAAKVAVTAARFGVTAGGLEGTRVGLESKAGVFGGGVFEGGAAHSEVASGEVDCDRKVGSALRAPQPTADDIPTLVAGACAAGLPVEIGVDGRPGTLPPSTSLAAYRIVQEALTNVVKHAPGAPTTVHLEYRPDRFVLTVRNRLPVMAPARLESGGYGIVGMRERASLAHGALRVGPFPGGWELQAELPVAVAG